MAAATKSNLVFNIIDFLQKLKILSILISPPY